MHHKSVQNDPDLTGLDISHVSSDLPSNESCIVRAERREKSPNFQAQTMDQCIQSPPVVVREDDITPEYEETAHKAILGIVADPIICKLKDVREKHGKNLVILHVNINSLKEKYDNVDEILVRNYADILCIKG